MTTRSPSPRAHAHHRLVRRAITVFIAAAMIGVPLAARALETEQTAPTRSADVFTFRDNLSTREESLGSSSRNSDLRAARQDVPQPGDRRATPGAGAVDETPATSMSAPIVSVPVVSAPLVSVPVTIAPSPKPVDESGSVPEDQSKEATPSEAAPAPGQGTTTSTAAPEAGTKSAPPTTSAPDSATPAPDPEETASIVLTDSYEWDEQSPRVETLQETLGVTVDGWYGHETVRAHRAALEFVKLPTDDLPVPPTPPGPSPDRWAALRQCEAGGDYSITNPSGTYRGAYQFDRSTWDSVAERHAPQLVGIDPAAASPADQDALASALYSERGSSPWPHCGRHLG